MKSAHCVAYIELADSMAWTAVNIHSYIMVITGVEHT